MGKVYKYGMKSKGFSPGNQPTEGWIDAEIDPLDEYINIIVYGRKLTEAECDQYDLDYLGSRRSEP